MRYYGARKRNYGAKKPSPRHMFNGFTTGDCPLYPALAEMAAKRNMVCYPEYRFDETRKWRFDTAIPSVKLAVEYEGGLFTQGRHIRPAGYISDMEKYNAAAAAGWCVLRYGPGKVEAARFMAEVPAAIDARSRCQVLEGGAEGER